MKPIILSGPPDEAGISHTTVHVYSWRFKHDLIEAGLIPRKRKGGNSRKHHNINNRNRKKNHEQH